MGHCWASRVIQRFSPPLNLGQPDKWSYTILACLIYIYVFVDKKSLHNFQIPLAGSTYSTYRMYGRWRDQKKLALQAIWPYIRVTIKGPWEGVEGLIWVEMGIWLKKSNDWVARPLWGYSRLCELWKYPTFKCFSLKMIEISGLTTDFWPYIRLILE